MKIRLAAIEDSNAILKVYSQYIDTPITFEYTLPTESEFADRVKSITGIYPYLVCEDNEKIIGYAYAHRQKEREAYQWNAELSIYIDQTYASHGIGKKMYGILMELLRMQGVRTVYGGVTLPNEKSERLHTALGFGTVGVYHNTGYKCGKWLDVIWFEKAILSDETTPQPILPIIRLPEEKVNAVFQAFYKAES